MYAFKRFFLHSPVHYLLALLLSVIIGLFRFSTLPDGLATAYVLYEVSSVAGCFTFFIGALLTVSHFGAFDIFAYAFTDGRAEKRKYKNYADYSNARTEKRTRAGYIFVPYYVVGLVLVLISSLFV